MFRPKKHRCGSHFVVELLNILPLSQNNLTVLVFMLEKQIAAAFIVITAQLIELELNYIFCGLFQVFVSNFVKNWIFQSLSGRDSVVRVEFKQVKK